MADLKSMSRNLQERDRYVVNHGEGLTTIDFDCHVSLAEEGVGMAGRGGLAWGRGSSMDEAKRISCYVSIALWKKTMATLKEEVRSYRWIAEGYHRRRRGSRSRRRRVHYERQSLEDAGCCQQRVGDGDRRIRIDIVAEEGLGMAVDVEDPVAGGSIESIQRMIWWERTS
ncbi:hypothetical protein GW17_00019986 [Ensete ventricosum]|nr:hypothetical protein GW17_00019986 [Ensete ventricosum]